MLKIFRTNQLLLSILLIGYAAFMRMAYFEIPLTLVSGEPGIANYWISPFAQDPSIQWFLIALALISIQTWIANKIFFDHRLHRDLSLFAGVFLVLIASILPEFLSYSSFLAANVFLLLALKELLKVYRTTKSADILFNIGFFIGLASLFQPIYILFIIAIGFSIVNLKLGKFRDQFTVIAGTITPLFLIGVTYFLKDQFPLFWKQQWSGIFSLQLLLDWESISIPALIIMGGFTILVIANYGKILAKTKMEVQIKINSIYWFLGAGGLTIILAPSIDVFRGQAMVPMLGLLLGIYFTKIKPRSAEVWHLTIVIILFCMHLGIINNLF